ncbi:hypothetical protein LEP1GSC043_0020 [Leptospira weilii str. Ecochallenge]|uniref:Uncharacterized protein n=1 Tax=Leptospira weilii str. Ecochallenge TaxID=1049986 RepID=N1U8S5_9LEPT|nr:hypothetical protein LEP1GSC051_0339 [Leptospira sp. P2653]EMY15472.1 hypothetical protein LEP1GSC043_0020 [Leptospira weilii str. Ecochallenge]
MEKRRIFLRKTYLLFFIRDNRIIYCCFIDKIFWRDVGTLN